MEKQDNSKHTIATLGSHSALDVCEGAKQEGFATLVVAQRGREKTYLSYYKTRKRVSDPSNKEVGIVDEVLLVNKFNEMVNNNYLDLLKKRNAIFIPNRSFSVYVGYDNIEKRFPIPIFGNKYLLRAEERNEKKSQYYLMDKAKIRRPKEISSPEKIDNLAIVKVNEAKRSYERAFFIVSNKEDYLKKSEKLIDEGRVKREDLKNAKIEEFIVGAHFNFNFFYSPINDELELLGIDMRRQTDIEGYLRTTADLQLDLLKHKQPSNIEVGHVACTIRESLLEHVFEIAEKLVETCKKEYAPGIIGPFALQGAIVEDNNKEEFVCFDISFRIPGSPGTRFTPYSRYLFRENISFGRRIAMEIKAAEKRKEINKIVT